MRQGVKSEVKMKLLEQTAQAAKAEKGREDVAVLHINHCMDNTFYFNDFVDQLQ